MKKDATVSLALLFAITLGGGLCSSQSQPCGMVAMTYQNAPVHHYVYENGQYVPQFYRYDPYPHYRAYTYNVPPHYSVWNLHDYQGLDRGRGQEYARKFDFFKD